MHILLADKLHPAAIAEMQKLPGVRVSNRPELTADDLPAALGDVDVLVVRSTKVTRAALEAAPQLGLVIRAGSGVNTIDVAAASEKGIYVANCPGKNSAAVAELAMGLLLALERRIPDNVADLRNGKWNKKEYGKAQGLKGKTIGLVGTGLIGQEFIQRLRGFDVRILAWSRSLNPVRAEELGIEFCPNLLDLARKCDVVSVHVALAPETRGMLGAEFLEAMKPGAILLNTSRAEVVDNDALLKAMETKGLRAGLDVFPSEPGTGTADYDHPIAKHKNCYGTHHIGASTDEAEFATGMDAVRLAGAFLKGDPIPNCVNLRRAPQGGHALVVRHEDRVGVLAGVFGALKQAGLNVQEMENQVFDGCKAACARILLDSPAPGDVVAALQKVDGVLHVSSTGPQLVTA